VDYTENSPFVKDNNLVVHGWLVGWLAGWLAGWLVGCNLTARQHRKVNLCQFVSGGKPAQSARDGQRDTMHDNNASLTQFTVKHSMQLHKRNNRLSNRMTCLLLR